MELWWLCTTLTVEIGREGEPASFAGEAAGPRDFYVRNQNEVDLHPTNRERRVAKLIWLAWFG